MTNLNHVLPDKMQREEQNIPSGTLLPQVYHQTNSEEASDKPKLRDRPQNPQNYHGHEIQGKTEGK